MWSGDRALFSTVGNSEALLEDLTSCLCLGSRIDIGVWEGGKETIGSAASIPESGCPWAICKL